MIRMNARNDRMIKKKRKTNKHVKKKKPQYKIYCVYYKRALYALAIIL